MNSQFAKVRIVIDAMGGDFAPVNEVRGALLAIKEKSEKIEIILVGKEDLLKKELQKQGYNHNQNSIITIVNADEVVGMEDSPMDSYKTKPNSSISIGLDLVKTNKADTFISAGNTGAVMATSTLKLGRIKGVGRPTIGSIFPTEKGKTMVFDVGASVDCRPNHLLEFAIMGNIYMKYIYGIKKPRIALLNIGEEKNKGNELTVETYKLLERANLNFIGNVEGRDVLKGKADVIVCDGFIGNVILKFAEGVLDILKSKFRNYANEGFLKKILMGIMNKSLKSIFKDFDYQQYGGVPLLGVEGVSIIGHGKSTPLAIKNMIFKAEEIFEKKVISAIRSEIDSKMG